jgi:hypothetical protein
MFGAELAAGNKLIICTMLGPAHYPPPFDAGATHVLERCEYSQTITIKVETYITRHNRQVHLLDARR